ncbi:hypothetical protein [Planococcus halotolerans]|uniref:GLUG domain-containing protein n=1 Tax=Planococcus halotolerans TaxID=2233542 RepID=A0A365KM55_9BACL|nr:hypothetical protein [Planococcus halotolerans]QHJ71630.1 hypothetical protein DNR44_013770 [Planococcus halotolerans]RAZ74153.1 hypothetical protein DP120_16370 [Planococcus halotolerans]
MLGSGTQASPYQITTAVEFNSIRNNLTAYYILMNDISLTSYTNFVPIGTSTTAFKGTLDGNGFKVRGLKVNRNATYTGLFGYIENATIKKLGVVDANVNSQTSNYSGIITGQMIGASFIDQCYSTGVLNGQYGQGGICGWHSGGTISNSWSNASINSLGRVGGIVGHIVSTSGFVTTSYSYSPITAPQLAGGVVGSTVVVANTTNSYFNTDIYPTSSGGTGLTTSQFANSVNLVGFDSAIWGFADYPFLKAFGVPSLPAKKVTVTVTSHSGIVLSFLNRSKRQLQSVVTTTQPITSNVSKRATAIAESMIDDIVSNVEVLANANIKTHIISSDVSGIGSTIERKVKAIRSVESDLQPFSIITEVIVPVDIQRPVYAMVYIMENQSNINSITNKSDTDIRENATETSVI